MVTETTIPKGYQQTDVGVIPDDWDVKKLKDVFLITAGGDLTKDKFSSIQDNKHPYPIYSNALTDEGIYGYSEDYQYDENCITVTARGSIGTSNFRNEKFNAIGRLLILNPKVECDCFFISEYINQRVRFSVESTGVPQLTAPQISNYEIALPPTKTEQTAISVALSDADELISKLEEFLAKKRNIKQGAMQELLTGKKRLPGFSGKWEVKFLAELFTFSGGYTASREELSEEGFCYLHYGDIHKSNKTYIDVSEEYSDIPKLDIPINRVSKKSVLNTGDIVFVDASEDDEGASRHIVVRNSQNIIYISGLHTIVLKSKDESLDNTYKQYCFQTRDVKMQFKFYAVGTKVSGISKTNIEKIQIPVPPKPEQTAIAQILLGIDAEIEELEQKLDKYRMIKHGMMQELLTGQTRLISTK